MALHPALSFGAPQPCPDGISCTIAWQGQPIATLTRTDTPEAEYWEPGIIAVRVPGFACYTVQSLRTGAVLSSIHRDAVLHELARRCDPTWLPPDLAPGIP